MEYRSLHSVLLRNSDGIGLLVSMAAALAFGVSCGEHRANDGGHTTDGQPDDTRPAEDDTGPAEDDTGPAEEETDPPVESPEDLPADQATIYEALISEYDATKTMTTEAFLDRYAVSFSGDLGYDPLLSANLDLIQGSSLALSAEAETALSDKGFVIVRDRTFPSFFNGYEQIYQADLPVYVSADSILEAIHRSYDMILEFMEISILYSDLGNLLDSLRSNLQDSENGVAGLLDASTIRDLDVYLAVAKSLLEGRIVPPVAGGDAAEVEQLYDLADASEGMSTVSLFGVDRQVDFSQFTPRGHYYYNEWGLETYFRAMIWLGRIDFRLVETELDGTQRLNRPQVEAAVALEQLMTDEDRERYNRINTALELFVGESDNMTPLEIPSLLGDLGISGLPELATKTDDEIKEVILTKGYGTQSIASHIMARK